MRHHIQWYVAFVAFLALAGCGEVAGPGAVGVSTLALTSPIPYKQLTTSDSTTPAQAGSNLLTLGYGNILMRSSPGWGGAIYDYTCNGSGNLVNRHDAGRLWQSMVNVYEDDDVHFINPTEAGDTYNRGSALYQFQNTSYNTQATKSVPFGFLNQLNEDNLGGNANVAVQFNGMTLGKELTLAFNNDNNVARYVTKVFTNVPVRRVSANLPILYLPGNFRLFTTYDAASGAWLRQTVNSGSVNVHSQGYTTCGGIMAENAERTVGVALYGCKPGIRSGGARHLRFSNHSANGDADPLADDTTALMAGIDWADGVGLPAGESTFTTYIIVCRAAPPAGAACVNSMARLYNAGY